MKKTLALIATLAVAGIAGADLAVLFQSTGNTIMKEGFTFPATGPGQVLDAGALVQLIWKADNVGYQTDDLLDPISLLNQGEFLLASGATTGGAGNFSLGQAIKGNADVGNADILSGHFYVRIFDSAAPTVGSYFLEYGIRNPTLTQYDPQTASTIYSLSGGVTSTITDQNTTVIPEPGTIGMMGLAGIGMYLARKKSRR
jgi:hypothetical protein